MFRVFAVDPVTVAHGWRTFSNTAGRFGVERGRLIADYPSAKGGQSWAKVVLAASRDVPEVERKRIVERLMRLRPAIVQVPRQFKRGDPWINNVVAEHARNAWDAVLTDDPQCTLDVALHPDDLDDEAGLFCVPHDDEVAREAEAVAALMAPLLHASKRLLLVDPHFMDNGPLRWTSIAAALMREARRGPIALVETVIHTGVSREGAGGDVRFPTPNWKARVKGALGPRLPIGAQATVVRWDRPNDFHPRYVLTDRGGVAVDWGLDERVGGRTDIHRLTDGTWQARLDKFDTFKAADQPFDEFTVCGTGG